MALFADVSGFTPMSEALGRTGKRGTEELTELLNSYFEPTIELIHSFGGMVGKFAGDAMMVLFPHRGGRAAQRGAARRALQCALDMQASMERYRAIETSAGTFSLTVKAGLALGSVVSVTVGDPELQLEHVLAGRPLDLCAEAEHHAEPGDVIAHADVIAAAEGREVTAAFSRVTDLAPRARRTTKQTPVVGPADAIARYLHPSLAARVRAGQTNLVNEHRKVTVIFGRFEELDYEADEDAAAKLQAYAIELVRCVERFGGCLRQIDMGDKGSKYIVLFGAPIAHEDDGERALRCAEELHRLPGSVSAIGINTGFAFCGLVGSDARREYAVVGDAVNLAARLMQAAGFGQTLVSGSTREQAREAVGWRALEPMRVKGKAEPVEVFEPQERREPQAPDLHEPAHRLPMVGRAREREAVLELLQRVGRGTGQILAITGEAGMGKSRLVAEVAALSAEAGLTAYSGAAQSYGSTTSYLVWRDLWRAFFGIVPSLSPAAQLGHLEQQVARLPAGVSERLPLLGAVLNLPLPDNELTGSLEAEVRMESMLDLLLTCLRERARSRPLLLVLEDCHWIDAASQTLLELIGRNLSDLPVLLVVVHRTPQDEHGPVAWARRRPNFREVGLVELPPEEVEQLIALKLEQLFGAGASAPAPLVTRVGEQAQGNPFYVEEILNFVHERGVDLADPGSLAALDLPDSLHSLIMARIDSLDEGDKSALKLASVIGRTFRAAWLWSSYPEVGAPDEVRQRLNRLDRLDLTPLDRPEPELEYIFKHITTQEVAYESLAFGTRESLHERLGKFIEHTYPDEIAQYLDVLAHHYGRSRNTGKQRDYFRLAGDAAKASYANESALDYYERLLALVPEPEQTDVLLRLGEVRQLLGGWDEAERLYREALALAEELGSELDQARCRSSLGTLLSYTESFDEALTWLESARTEFARLRDERELARMLEQLIFTYWQSSDFASALERSEELMQLAERLEDQSLESVAVYHVGLLHWRQGDPARALVEIGRARELAAAIDYKRGIIHADNDLAGLYAERGDYARAIERLDEAYAVASEIGYQQAAGVIVGNAGELCARQGDYERALACCERALQIAAQLGDRTGILDAVGRIGTICAAEGREREAHRLFDRAIAVSRAVNDRWFLSESLLDKARLHEQTEEMSEAEPLAREALTVAREAENREVEFKARLLLSQVEVELGMRDREETVAELEAIVEEESAEDWQRAAVHYGIWMLDPGRADSNRAAAAIYRRLHASAPDAEYRRRYERLTGKKLTQPARLSRMSQTVELEPVDLERLIAEAELVTSVPPDEAA